MAYDYYSQAEQIACELDAQAHGQIAKAVRADVSEGSTSTEILMALQHHLSPLARIANIAPGTRARICELLENIEKALAP